MLRDGVYTGDFSAEAWAGLSVWCEALDGGLDDRLRDCTPENWAWIWFQLRRAADRLEWFPRGKWATLQHIERLLNECAQASVDTAA